jgi:hypothetical protein
MKSGVWKLDGSLSSTEVALDQIEEQADGFGFDSKDAAFARLLAEEAINAFSSIINVNEGSIWVETKEADFEIHLKASAEISPDHRENLIELSKAKKNTPRKGIIGRITSFIDYVASDMAVGEDPFMIYGMSEEMVSFASALAPTGAMLWSMKHFQKKQKEKDELSEIEKSIIERFADDIIVSIALKTIELIIKKTKR